MSKSKPSKKSVEHLRHKDKQVLMEFYKVQWDDIHAMDNLDWRVALIFIPLIGAVSFVFGIALELDLRETSYYIHVIKAISFITYLLCLYGLWTVAKGQAHTMLKFETLSMIEKKLGYDSFIFIRPKDYMFVRVWKLVASRRFVLFFVYLFLGFSSYSMIITRTSNWSLHTLFELDVILVPSVFASIIAIIHGCDYWLHRYEMKKRRNKP